jgi:HAD superfamily hydrolase (TIGR01484 family)
MLQIRLLALDLDGTLLTDDKKITENTKYWIQQAQEAGITVIFATGRGWQNAVMYWEELGLTGPMVLVNGADLRKSPDEPWIQHVISKEEIRRLHELAVHHDARFWGYSMESFTRDKEWTDEMLEREWLKFGIRHEDPETLQTMWNTVESWGTLEITQSTPVNMEISVKGVTKETGVRRVCQLLGIGMEEVAAAGDSMNDMYLLQAAGLGVAMGNADETVKSIADMTTDTNENEGVAKLIQWLLNGS